MLTVFDTVLEAKEMKKDILLLMYDLSSAFDCVSHKLLLAKLKIYGFNDNSMKWIKSFLEQRKQMVTVAGKLSSGQEINIGTPQGSRLSPLLFICMMADMDLYTKEKLVNFADDTQSLVINDTLEEALENSTIEANNVINFFSSNNLVINPEKTAVLCNDRGKGINTTVQNVGGQSINSTYSEKLLGLHINSDLEWKTHVDKLSVELKKKNWNFSKN